MGDLGDSPPQRFLFVFSSQLCVLSIIIWQKKVCYTPLSTHPHGSFCDSSLEFEVYFIKKLLSEHLRHEMFRLILDLRYSSGAAIFVFLFMQLLNRQNKKKSVYLSCVFKGVVNCQNSRDKGPPEGNSARG